MPYCPKCGTEIKRGVKFCLECGTRIVPTAPPEKKPTRVTPLKPKGKGRSKLIAGGVAVVVLVVGLLVVYLGGFSGVVRGEIRNVEVSSAQQTFFIANAPEKGHAVLDVIVSGEGGDKVALYKNSGQIAAYYLERQYTQEHVALKMADRFTTPNAGTYTVKISRNEQVLDSKTMAFGGADLDLLSVNVVERDQWYYDSIQFFMNNQGDLPAVFKEIHIEVGWESVLFDVNYGGECPGECTVMPGESVDSAQVLGAFWSFPFDVAEGESIYIKVIDSGGRTLTTYTGSA